jgi:hypothetical protein
MAIVQVPHSLLPPWHLTRPTHTHTSVCWIPVLIVGVKRQSVFWNMTATTTPPDELADLLRGHTVVAVPRGRLLDATTAGVDVVLPRARSMSGGRRRTRNTDDLVQDVYTRLGVVRRIDAWAHVVVTSDPSCGDTTYDTADFDFAAAARSSPFGKQQTLAVSPSPRTCSKDHHHHHRGRSKEQSPSPTRVLRSRSLGQRWPPARDTAAESSTVQPRTTWNNTNRTSTAAGAAARVSPVGIVAPKGYCGRPTTTAACDSSLVPVALHEPKSIEWSDEKKESEPEKPGNAEEPSIPSIRERISVFSGPPVVVAKKSASARAAIPKEYAAQFAVRDHPPKVDIYGGGGGKVTMASEDNNNNQEGSLTASRETILLSTPVALRKTKSTVPMSTNNNNNSKTFLESPAHHRATRSMAGGGKLVASLLAALQQPSKTTTTTTNATPRKLPITINNAPVETIVAGDGSVHSAAMSSVSDHDAAPPNKSSPDIVVGRSTTKASWHDRHRARSLIYPEAVAATTTTSSSPKLLPTNTTTTSSSSAEDVNKILQERVRVQVAEMEGKLTAQMRKWAQQMDDTIQMRVEAVVQGRVSALQATVEALQAAAATTQPKL